MDKLFVDTDIVIDLLSERHPHYTPAAELFSLADKKEIIAYVSALTFANANYILSSRYSAGEVRKKLFMFNSLVKITPIDDKITELALSSDFKDFEDAMQYFSAIESQLKI